MDLLDLSLAVAIALLLGIGVYAMIARFPGWELVLAVCVVGASATALGLTPWT